MEKIRLKLLGHLLRAKLARPHPPSLVPNSRKIPRYVPKGRAGKPREQWLVEALREAYEHMTTTLYPENDPQTFDPENQNHIR